MVNCQMYGERVCSCSGDNLKFYGSTAVRNYYKSKLNEQA